MDEARLRPGCQFGSVYVCVFVSALKLLGDRKDVTGPIYKISYDLS